MNIKYVSLMLALIFAGCSYSTHSLVRHTVKITNLAENSGGSGSIVSSSSTMSRVLTNAHVCRVVAGGGIVHTYDNTKFFVKSFKMSEIHDLCLITVMAKLPEPATISADSPSMSQVAITVGHPKLLPTIISTGYFSNKQVINVITGFRPCNEQEKQTPGLDFICSFLGKVPAIKSYEAIALSALIQPGSSGSAVYNSSGEIAAVVFAGSGDIGFGFAVPWEYVSYFLNVESKTLSEEVPTPELEMLDKENSRAAIIEYFRKLNNICVDPVLSKKVKKICWAWNK